MIFKLLLENSIFFNQVPEQILSFILPYVVSCLPLSENTTDWVSSRLVTVTQHCHVIEGDCICINNKKLNKAQGVP